MNTTQNEHAEFRTTDIVLAACLKLYQYEMVDIEVEGNKGTFVFLNVDRDIMTSYGAGRCKVEPQNFNNVVKQLTTSVRRMANMNNN